MTSPSDGSPNTVVAAMCSLGPEGLHPLMEGPFLLRVYIPREHFLPVSTRYCCLLFPAWRSSLTTKVDKSYVLMVLCTSNSGKGVTSAGDVHSVPSLAAKVLWVQRLTCRTPMSFMTTPIILTLTALLLPSAMSRWFNKQKSLWISLPKSMPVVHPPYLQRPTPDWPVRTIATGWSATISQPTNLPRDPASLDDLTIVGQWATTTGPEPQQFLQYDNGAGSDGHVIVFATQQGLQLLARSDTWLMDGNFAMSPSQFKQLYIRVPLGETAVTVVYAFLQSKTQSINEELLHAVLDKCSEYMLYPDPLTVLVDFELSVINAVRSELGPHVNIQGCFYHLTQSTWKPCLKGEQRHPPCLSKVPLS